MNNILEDKINQQAGNVFVEGPAAGHRERFESKLFDRKKKKHTAALYRYSAIAAAVIGGTLLFQIAFRPTNVPENDSLSEVQNYYSMQLQNEITSTELLISQINKSDQAELLKDIELMQKEIEFNTLTPKEKNVTIIVSTYSSKIEALQHIQHILTNKL